MRHSEKKERITKSRAFIVPGPPSSTGRAAFLEASRTLPKITEKLFTEGTLLILFAETRAAEDRAGPQRVGHVGGAKPARE